MPDDDHHDPMPRPRPGPRRRLAALAGAALVLLAAGFSWTALEDSWRAPATGTTSAPPAPPGPTLRLMALNLAKLGFHRGGLDFAPAADVRARLGRVAAAIRAARVDLLFLSEVVSEAGWSGVDQVAELAEAAGFHAWAGSDDYRWGLPFLRIRSGNALLSRLPLRADRVVQLPGAAPPWDPTGNRRILWAAVDLGGATGGAVRWLPCASLRLDSFDLANNARQVEAVLADLPDGPVLLGGDLNAEPHDRSLALLRGSGRFAGVFEGAPTFPADAPTRRLDTVLVPAGWTILSAEVLDLDLSDHEPVLVEVAP